MLKASLCAAALLLALVVGVLPNNCVAAVVEAASQGNMLLVLGDTMRVTGDNADNLIASIALRVDRRVVAETRTLGRYALDWFTNGQSVGAHRVQLVAVKGGKAILLREMWVEIVKEGPVVVVAPAAGAELVDQTELRLSSTAGCKIEGFVLTTDGGSKLSCGGSTTKLDIPKLGPGVHRLEITVCTDRGTIVLDPLSFTVPMQVQLSRPTDDESLIVTDTASDIELSATIHQSLKPIRLQFLCDGVEVGRTDGQTSSLTWDASQVQSGTHRLSARVTDADGKTYSSREVSVRLKNLPLQEEAEQRERERREEAAREEAERLAAEKQHAIEEEAAWERAYAAALAAMREDTANRKTGTVRGTLTYYFNSNFRNKADTGAEVWLLCGDVPIPEDWLFIGLDDCVLLSSDGDSRQRRIPVLKHTMADGAGNYEIRDVPAGRYTVVIQSKHTNGSADGRVTNRDALNRVFRCSADVRPEQTTDVSHDFGITLL